MSLDGAPRNLESISLNGDDDCTKYESTVKVSRVDYVNTFYIEKHGEKQLKKKIQMLI